MPHHRFDERPHITHEQIDAGIRRAHKLRSEAVGKFFRFALDRRHRALNVVAERPCPRC